MVNNRKEDLTMKSVWTQPVVEDLNVLSTENGSAPGQLESSAPTAATKDSGEKQAIYTAKS